MKKKILTISIASLSAIVISALLACGILLLIRNKNIEETGNVLGVEWYHPEKEEFVITTAEELNELSKLSYFYDFQNQTVKLGADIVMNEGNAKDFAQNKPSKRWAPISDFAGVFDGQNHTISGLYGRSHEVPMALFASTARSAVIRDTKLVNSYFETGGASGAASFVAKGDGKFEKLYSDAIIVNKGDFGGGIIAIVNTFATVEECWFEGDIQQTGRALGGIVGAIKSGRVNINHCLFSGSLYSSNARISYDTTDAVATGGLCGVLKDNAGVNITDSYVSGKIDSNHKTYLSTVIGRLDQGSTVNATKTYVSTKIPGKTTMTVANGTVTAWPIEIDIKEMTGVKAYQWSRLDFDNYWAAVESNTPVLKYFADSMLDLTGVEKEYDLDWYDSTQYNFTIHNLKELYGLAMLSQENNFENTIIKLAEDIVVNEGKATDWAKGKNMPSRPWFTIGNQGTAFKGEFNGQMHTISGVYYASTADYGGIFGHVGLNGQVNNLKVTNTLIDASGDTDTQYIGGVVGMLSGNIDTVYSDAIVKCDGWGVGGIVGQTRYSHTNFKKSLSIKNAWFDGEIYGGEKSMMFGGIIGRATLTNGGLKTLTEISNCLNTGKISGTAEETLLFGGLVGYVFGEMKINFTDCLSAGSFDVKIERTVGSYVGRDMGKGVVTFTNCYATKEAYSVQGVPRAHNSFKTANKTGDVIFVSEDIISGIGAHKYTVLDFNENWAAIKNETPVLKAFAEKALNVKNVEKMVDTSWYNREAKEYTIKNLKQLYGFAQLSQTDMFENKTVKLAADIVVNKGKATDWEKGNNLPNNPWFTIGTVNMAFAGKFDGQMHTISGVYYDSEADYGGIFGHVWTTGEVSKLRVTNSFYDMSGDTDTQYVGGVIGMTNGKSESLYCDTIIKCDGWGVGGIIGQSRYNDKEFKKPLVISNCWFNGKIYGDTLRTAGGIVGRASEQLSDYKAITEFQDCLNTGYISSGLENYEQMDSPLLIGGMVGYVFGTFKINFTDCLNAGSFHVKFNDSVGSFIGRDMGKGVASFKNAYTTRESYQITNNPIVHNKFKEANLSGLVLVLPEQYAQGKNAYTYMDLGFEDAWVVVKNGTPELKAFSTSKEQITDFKDTIKADKKWFESKLKDGKVKDGTVFTIATVSDLLTFPLIVDSGESFNNCTVKLTKQDKVYDLNPGWDASIKKAPNGNQALIWEPIGDAVKQFDGTFQGNGAIIKGIYATQTDKECLGFFGRANENSVIKNFTLSNSYFFAGGTEGGMTGSVIGRTRGVIHTVKADDSVYVDAENVYTGGIVGIVDTTKKTALNQVWFAGNVNSSNKYVGGIVSSIWNAPKEESTLKDCLFTGTMEVTSVHTGGLIGYLWSSAKIEDCLSDGEIYAKVTGNKGSIIGLFGKNCTLEMTCVYTTGGLYREDKVTPFTENPGDATADSYKGTEWIAVDKEEIKGSRAYVNTELHFYWKEKDENGPWVIVADATPELKMLSTSSNQLTDLSGVIKPSREWFDSKLVDGNVQSGTVFEIATVNDLMALPTLVDSGITFKGCTVKLTKADKTYDLNPGWDASTKKAPTGENSVVWEPIGEAGAGYRFEGIFDGNGATIQGIYMTEKQATQSGGSYECLGLFARTESTSVIENFKLANSYISNQSASGTGAIVGRTNGLVRNIKVEDSVYLVAKTGLTGGVVGILDGALETTWFDGHADVTARPSGGMVGAIWNTNGKPSLKNCLYTGTLTSTSYNVGGMIGWVTVSASVENCLSNGENYIQPTFQYGTIFGGVSSNQKLTLTGVYTTGKTFDLQGVAKTSEAPGLDSGASYSPFTTISENEIKGMNAYEKMDLDFYWKNKKEDGVWLAITDATPELKMFTKAAKDKWVTDFSDALKPSRKWFDSKLKNGQVEKGTVFEIESNGDLLALPILVDSGVTFEGCTVRLTKENKIYDLNPGWSASTKSAPAGERIVNWEPIGDATGNWFNGVLDGNGATIKGMYIAQAGKEYVGLFARTNSASVIKNLKISNSYISATTTNGGFNGCVAGEIKGSVENVYVDNSVYLYTENPYTGGIVGRLNHANAKLSQVWFAGEITPVYGYAGGLAGQIGAAYSGGALNDCLYTGKMYPTGIQVGGLIGVLSTNATIKRCLSNGGIYTAKSWNFGSVVGLMGSGKQLTMQQVYTNGGLYSVDGSRTYPEAVGDANANSYNGTTWTKVSAQEIQGEAALGKLQGFDFYSNSNPDGIWVAKEKGPELRPFAEVLTLSVAPKKANVLSMVKNFLTSIF